MKKAAIFVATKLGDGIIFPVLSENLRINGYQTTTFHHLLPQMQNWFPNLPAQQYPLRLDDLRLIMHFSEAISEHIELLDSYDWIFIEPCPETLGNELILRIANLYFREKTTVLCPLTFKGGKYRGDWRFNPKMTVADNIEVFCREILKLAKTTNYNGCTPPSHLFHRKHPNRIVLHPVSSEQKRNWPKKKFFALYDKLLSQKLDPVFCLTEQEKKEFFDQNYGNYQYICHDNIDDLASYLYESGYFIGNDSGMGHLASCLKIPTLTIFSERYQKYLWKPAWGLTSRITAPAIIPKWRMKWLREKIWGRFIGVSKVYNLFCKLCVRDKQKT